MLLFYGRMHRIIFLTQGVAQKQLCLIGECYMAYGICILLLSLIATCGPRIRFYDMPT